MADLKLSTGRAIDSMLSLDSSGGLRYGYDGHVYPVDVDPVAGIDDEAIAEPIRREIAEMVIARWQRWAETGK